MNNNDLKPASQLAMRYGVKSIIYGPPGSGKTPMLATAPRPVLCVSEPGMLSLRNSNVPCFDAFTYGRIKEFMVWCASPDSRNFDTLCFDSVSQMAEIVLKEKERTNSHGLKAYGEMADQVMDWLNTLYYMPQKHIVLLAKEGLFGEPPTAQKRPYFPGKELNIKVPHAYDEILHMAMATVPGLTMPTVALRTKTDYSGTILARDRTGLLAEFEPPNLSQLFAKAMA